MQTESMLLHIVKLKEIFWYKELFDLIKEDKQK